MQVYVIEALPDPLETQFKPAISWQGSKVLDNEAAGKGPVLVPPHAIRDSPESMLGHGQKGVFVVLPNLADIRARGAAPGNCGHPASLTRLSAAGNCAANSRRRDSRNVGRLASSGRASHRISPWAEIGRASVR